MYAYGSRIYDSRVYGGRLYGSSLFDNRIYGSRVMVEDELGAQLGQNRVLGLNKRFLADNRILVTVYTNKYKNLNLTFYKHFLFHIKRRLKF